MAGKGTYTAYNRLKPIEQTFTDDLRFNEEMQFKKRQEKRIEDDKIKKENDKMIADISMSNSKLVPFDTKIRGLNDYVYRGIEEAKEQLPSLYKTLNNPNATTSQRIEARTMINNLENMPTALKNMSASLTAHVESQSKGISDGSLISTDEYGQALSNAFDVTKEGGLDADIIIDKNTGMPVIVYKDDNGKAHSITSNDFLSGKLPSARKAYDFDAIVKRQQDLIGTNKVVNQKGFTTTTDVTANQSSLSQLESNAKGLFKIDENGEPSDALYSFWVKDLNRPASELNTESAKEVQEVYKDRVLAGVDTEGSSEYDMSNALRSQELKDKKDKDKADSTYHSPEISVNPNTGEPDVREIRTQNVGEDPISGYVITFDDAVVSLHEDDQKRTTKNLIMGDDGNIYADEVVTITNYADYINGKSAKTKKEENVQLNITDFNNLARDKNIKDDKGNRFKNGKELKDYIDKKYQNISTTTTNEYGI